MDEIWRPIPGYEDYYEVSDQGRIRSLDRYVVMKNDRKKHLKGRILKPEFRKNTGYLMIKLSKDCNPDKWYIHRLVLTVFVGPPAPGQEACHSNDIRTDNRLENLRWDTHKANVHDAIKRQRHRNPPKAGTHCQRGHDFSIYGKPRPGGRSCTECRRLKERERYHRNKQL